MVSGKLWTRVTVVGSRIVVDCCNGVVSPRVDWKLGVVVVNIRETDGETSSIDEEANSGTELDWIGAAVVDCSNIELSTSIEDVEGTKLDGTAIDVDSTVLVPTNGLSSRAEEEAEMLDSWADERLGELVKLSRLLWINALSDTEMDNGVVYGKLLETCSDISGTNEEPATLDCADSDDTITEIEVITYVSLLDGVFMEVCSGSEAVISVDDPGADVITGNADDGPASAELCMVENAAKLEYVASDDSETSALLNSSDKLEGKLAELCAELPEGKLERVDSMA